MFQETQDESLLLKFWEDEQTYPQWYRDSTNAWTPTWDEHLSFCKSCWRIYANENSLVMVEKSGNVHLALRRGIELDDKRIDGLIALRNELFTTFPQLHGWVNDRNWGLKRVFVELGFQESGFMMVKGESHDKVLQWDCFVQRRPPSD